MMVPRLSILRSRLWTDLSSRRRNAHRLELLRKHIHDPFEPHDSAVLVFLSPERCIWYSVLMVDPLLRFWPNRRGGSA